MKLHEEIYKEIKNQDVLGMMLFLFGVMWITFGGIFAMMMFFSGGIGILVGLVTLVTCWFMWHVALAGFRAML